MSGSTSPSILVAPTAFKGTIDARVVARAMARGARAAVDIPVVELPLSDGGSGLIDALHTARGGVVRGVEVTGPVGDRVRARVLRLEREVIVETAEACGLHLVPDGRRDPLETTTLGVGDLIRAAASTAPAPDRIVAGLGGSGTVDGGAGMARALGWRLLDGSGRELVGGGGALEALTELRAPEEVRLPAVVGLADVDNPLLGPSGAAAVFGPQKGADADTVTRLERGLARLADALERTTGRDVRRVPGSGAAGGLGAGLIGFLDAVLVSGSDWVLDAVGFEDRLAGAAAVVTGEGAFDDQSAMGKITGAVLRRARRRGVPALVVAGVIDAPPGEGVMAVGGDGRRLGAVEIGRLVREALPRLLADGAADTFADLQARGGDPRA